MPRAGIITINTRCRISWNNTRFSFRTSAQGKDDAVLRVQSMERRTLHRSLGLYVANNRQRGHGDRAQAPLEGLGRIRPVPSSRSERNRLNLSYRLAEHPGAHQAPIRIMVNWYATACRIAIPFCACRIFGAMKTSSATCSMRNPVPVKLSEEAPPAQENFPPQRIHGMSPWHAAEVENRRFRHSGSTACRHGMQPWLKRRKRRS